MERKVYNDESKKIDLTKYPEGLEEIIKCCDFLPGTDEEKAAFIMGVYMPAIMSH